MTIDQLVTFFGWCTLINVVVLTITTLGIATSKDKISKLHGKMFKIEPSELQGIYMHYLANFKLFVLIFNLTPYLALLVIS